MDAVSLLPTLPGVGVAEPVTVVLEPEDAVGEVAPPEGDDSEAVGEAEAEEAMELMRFSGRVTPAAEQNDSANVRVACRSALSHPAKIHFSISTRKLDFPQIHLKSVVAQPVLDKLAFKQDVAQSGRPERS